MLFSRKKDKDPIDLSWLHTDMHSHLIPGIDDGSPDLKTSMEMIKGLSGFGYKKLITTPHIIQDIYPNMPETINKGLENLRAEINIFQLEVELGAAAEYFIDEYFVDQLKQKFPFLTISDNMVLVEFSMITAPMDLMQVLFELQIQNYLPVIAHPERYIYLNQKKEFFDDLKSAGSLFQLNLLSLTGYYGTAVMELADYLIKKNYYDFAGTDLHNIRHLANLNKLSSSVLYKKLKESGKLKNHLI